MSSSIVTGLRGIVLEPGGAMLGLWSLGTAPMSMRLHDHMLEYLAMLDEPARPDAGITTWSDWVR